MLKAKIITVNSQWWSLNLVRCLWISEKKLYGRASSGQKGRQRSYIDSKYSLVKKPQKNKNAGKQDTFKAQDNLALNDGEQTV